MDQLRAMRVFIRVVERGSFSAAAADLRLSHGMASNIVKEIEADLGVQLIRRTTRRMSLTEEGAAYFDRASTIVAEVDALRDRLAGDRDAVRGRVTLQAPVAFSRLVLGPSLDALMARHPQLELTVIPRDGLPDMVAEGIDLLLFTGALPDSGLIARSLGRFPVLTVAAPAYLDRHGPPGQPEELEGHRCIGILSATSRRPLDWRFRGGDGKTVLRRIDTRLCIESSETAIAAAEAGAGIVQNISYAVTGALASGRLREVLAPFRDPGPELKLVSLRPPAEAARLRAVADHVAALVAARQAQDARQLAGAPDLTET